MKSYLAAFLLAYLLPSSSVLRRTALALQDGAAPVRVTGTLIVSGNAVPGLPSVPATLTWRAPGTCRIESLPNAPEPLSWAVDKDTVTAPPTLTAALRAMCTMLGLGSNSLAETRSSLDRRLASWGVNTQALGLSRVKSGIIYEFGAAPGAQFGVFKDTFLPARLSQGGLEVLLSNYANLVPGATIPRTIEVASDSESLLTFNAISVERVGR